MGLCKFLGQEKEKKEEKEKACLGPTLPPP
jgi:hypothetical protein